MDGLLPIYKPRGMVSKDVSRLLQKILGKAVALGHVGTLDPMAEGVLPLLLGKATRLQDYLLNSMKIYDFTVKLGSHTDSLDLEGDLLFSEEVKPFDEKLLSDSLKSMIGSQIQTPPLYSAVKWQGKPLYEYARSGRGEEVPLAELSRPVEIFSASIISWDAGSMRVRVGCSKGTYVRVFAYDLAKKLGNLGVVTELKRLKSAGVDIQQCLNLDELSTLSEIQKSLVPMENLETGLLSIKVSVEAAAKILQGQKQVVAFPELDNNIQDVSFDKNQDFLLVGSDGKVFGIGVVVETLIDSSRNEKLIKLKRGL